MYINGGARGMKFVHGMPAGDRNVNAPVRTTRDRSNYLVKSREREFVSSPRANPGARRSLPVVRGIFSTRRRSNYCTGSESLPLSLSRACQESDASILQTFRDYVCTHGDEANRLIMWAFESSFYFLPCRAQEELLSWKSFAEFRKLSSGRPPSRFGYRCIACLESSSERSNPLNKE